MVVRMRLLIFDVQGQIFESNGNEMQISTPTVPFPYQLFSQISSSRLSSGALGLNSLPKGKMAAWPSPKKSAEKSASLHSYLDI